VRHAQITGWGMHVPSTVITNDAFVKMGLDTTDEWITSRTGITQRRLVARDEATSDLAVKAARNALQVAFLSTEERSALTIKKSKNHFE